MGSSLILGAIRTASMAVYQGARGWSEECKAVVDRLRFMGLVVAGWLSAVAFFSYVGGVVAGLFGVDSFESALARGVGVAVVQKVKVHAVLWGLYVLAAEGSLFFGATLVRYDCILLLSCLCVGMGAKPSLALVVLLAVGLQRWPRGWKFAATSMWVFHVLGSAHAQWGLRFQPAVALVLGVVARAMAHCAVTPAGREALSPVVGALGLAREWCELVACEPDARVYRVKLPNDVLARSMPMDPGVKARLVAEVRSEEKPAKVKLPAVFQVSRGAPKCAGCDVCEYRQCVLEALQVAMPCEGALELLFKVQQDKTAAEKSQRMLWALLGDAHVKLWVLNRLVPKPNASPGTVSARSADMWSNDNMLRVLRKMSFIGMLDAKADGPLGKKAGGTLFEAMVYYSYQFLRATNGDVRALQERVVDLLYESSIEFDQEFVDAPEVTV